MWLVTWARTTHTKTWPRLHLVIISQFTEERNQNNTRYQCWIRDEDSYYSYTYIYIKIYCTLTWNLNTCCREFFLRNWPHVGTYRQLLRSETAQDTKILFQRSNNTNYFKKDTRCSFAVSVPVFEQQLKLVVSPSVHSFQREKRRYEVLG